MKKITEKDVFVPDFRYEKYIVECVNNLIEWGFSFDFDSISWDIRKMEPMGLTTWSPALAETTAITITLNQGLITQTKEMILDTIYHELAHVIAGYQCGHGKQWKDIVSVIRKKTGLPMRVVEDENNIEDCYYVVGHQYRLRCDRCAKVIGVSFIKMKRILAQPSKFKHENCGGHWIKM